MATTQLSSDKDERPSLSTAGISISRRRAMLLRGLPTAKYLLTTEVHTYAFSVAANVILSFFPFIVLMLTLVRRVFHSPAMKAVIVQLLQNYLPSGQDFLIRNLDHMVKARKGAQVASLAVLLITSTGVFLPLEVALNQIWEIKKNRSYLRNQLMSLLLAFSCGALAMISVALTAGNQLLVQAVFGDKGGLVAAISYVIMKIFAIPASIAIFFLIYWLLPNGKIPWRAVMPAAITTGLLWEVAKYLYILALPWLNFQEVYGPFSMSVTLMFWAFISGLLLLGGAHFSATSSINLEARRKTDQALLAAGGAGMPPLIVPPPL